MTSVIVTGSTGLVGEGVLLECLSHPRIDKVLSISRKPSGHEHLKLTELLVPDFMNLSAVETQLAGFDGCLYCAGISSVGMTEAEYTRITYDTALHFAQTLVRLNPNMVFSHISGRSTDSSEQGRVMWARVKGKTENALAKLPFKSVYNFRPALMRPSPGQLHVKTSYRVVAALAPVFSVFSKNTVSTMHQVGRAMIQSVLVGAPKPVLEVADLNALAAQAG